MVKFCYKVNLNIAIHFFLNEDLEKKITRKLLKHLFAMVFVDKTILDFIFRFICSGEQISYCGVASSYGALRGTCGTMP